jgi:hypothetical protein
LKGRAYYRLRLRNTGLARYSQTKTVNINSSIDLITITPNPVVNDATLTIINNNRSASAQVIIFNSAGAQLSADKVMLSQGTNTVPLPIQAAWPSGTYVVWVVTEQDMVSKKIILNR